MSLISRLGCVVLMVAICGCGSGQPDTVNVTGKVTYNGEPVDGASVVFAAASGQQRPAAGTTDSSGNFTLTTFDKDDGAIPGSFTVMVTKTETTGKVLSEDEEHAAINAGEEVPELKTVDKLPTKYGNSEETDLTAEVTEAGPNNFEFELKD